MHKNSILHISTYKFAKLHDIEYLKLSYWNLCFALQLKGAIVFSPEGFNLMLAGPIDSMKVLIDTLEQDPRFKNLPNKISYCDEQPFKHLQIKHKDLLVPKISTELQDNNPAPYITPKDFKRWMDQGSDDKGNEFVILDTRNGFEFRQGAFTKSKHFDLVNFSDYPEAVKQNKDETLPSKETPIVTFCTGGIRCEKAAPYLIAQGYKKVFQLQGGILDYFKEVGGDHYDGDCFVFDGRTAVDPRNQAVN